MGRIVVDPSIKTQLHDIGLVALVATKLRNEKISILPKKEHCYLKDLRYIFQQMMITILILCKLRVKLCKLRYVNRILSFNSVN